jgi:hypothetical protein
MELVQLVRPTWQEHFECRGTEAQCLTANLAVAGCESPRKASGHWCNS